jgi:hypothetical protein
MASLQIHTGQICLDILDDQGNQRGVFKFNPNDVSVAKRVFALQNTIQDKFKEYEERYKDVQNEQDGITLLDETIQYFRGVIDEIFGAGTSQILFGDCNTFSMFEDFFNGITPYYTKASKDRVQKYKKATKK